LPVSYKALLGLCQRLAVQAIFQSAIAPDVQGRVFSLIGAGATAMMPLSLLIAGPVADWLSVRFWYALGGTVCIPVTVIASFNPTIMNIERNQGSAGAAFAPDR
jgi:DHA3 family macrolide efflux protein-like MFS transporter